MNSQREIIKRIKKEPFSIFFPDNRDTYRTGMSEVEQIEYHVTNLQDIAGQSIDHLVLISGVLSVLVERLKTMFDAHDAVDKLINPEV